MTREEAIQQIETLWPADSIYDDTATAGKKLLEQAKRNVGSWRNEPDDVIMEYAMLCIQKERRMGK